MSIFNETEAAAEVVPPAPPCKACGAPSECEVWGHRICYPCFGAFDESVDGTRLLAWSNGTLTAIIADPFSPIQKPDYAEPRRIVAQWISSQQKTQTEAA